MTSSTTSITQNEWKTMSNAAIRKFFQIENMVKTGLWEPVTYSKNWSEGDFTYEVCDIRDANFLRFIGTGKTYRWNQHRYQIRYEMKQERAA